MLFVTLAVTGVMGFFLPFNLLTVSVHALLGFVFIAAIGFHVKNNFRQLKGYFSNRTALVLLLSVIGLIAIILYQPAPVKAILGLSRNLGPAVDRFEINGGGVSYHYTPAPHYKMKVDLMGGPAFDPDQAPYFAIWIENKSSYHIKSLYHSDRPGFEEMLPYWHHKRAEYLRYKREADRKDDVEKDPEVDAMSSATENDSFDPEDYIVPKDPGKEAPYRVLIEINKPGDGNAHHSDQPSLVYSVEVDNKDPRTYQVFEIVGYPKLGEEKGEMKWSLHYADETITTARELMDSALLMIERSKAD